MKSTRNKFRIIMSVVICMAMLMSVGAMSAFAEDGQLICELTEHTHSINDGCYELRCETEESDGHYHSESCYETTEQLICDVEHEHTDGSYQIVDTLICELEEYEGHKHDDSCYELVCEKSEHTHNISCYNKEYLVSYVYEGEGTTGSHIETFSYCKTGDVVSVKTGYISSPGYVFNGWTTYDVEISDGCFVMPDHEVVFVGTFSVAQSAYTVVTYRQNGAGSYVEYSRESVAGVTGEYTNVSAPAVSGYEAQQVVQQIIKSDGSTTVNVYYDLVQASYKVITYLEVSKGSYSESASITMSGEIGSMTKAVAYEIDDYVLTRSVEQQEILRDGSTVVKLYYDKLTPFAAAATTTLKTDTATTTETEAEEETAELDAEPEVTVADEETAASVEIVEIADDETPLASGLENENQGGFQYGYLLVGAIIIAGVWWLILLLKRRKEEEEQAV